MAEVDPQQSNVPGGQPERGVRDSRAASIERFVGLFAGAAGLDVNGLPDSQQPHTNHEGEQ